MNTWKDCHITFWTVSIPSCLWSYFSWVDNAYINVFLMNARYSSFSLFVSLHLWWWSLQIFWINLALTVLDEENTGEDQSLEWVKGKVCN